MEDDSRKPLTAREIIEKTGLPRSTVYDALQALTQRGYLRIVDNSGYALTALGLTAATLVKALDRLESSVASAKRLEIRASIEVELRGTNCINLLRTVAEQAGTHEKLNVDTLVVKTEDCREGFWRVRDCWARLDQGTRGNYKLSYMIVKTGILGLAELAERIVVRRLILDARGTEDPNCYHRRVFQPYEKHVVYLKPEHASPIIIDALPLCRECNPDIEIHIDARSEGLEAFTKLPIEIYGEQLKYSHATLVLYLPHNDAEKLAEEMARGDIGIRVLNDGVVPAIMVWKARLKRGSITDPVLIAYYEPRCASIPDVAVEAGLDNLLLEWLEDLDGRVCIPVRGEQVYGSRDRIFLEVRHAALDVYIVASG